MRPASPTVHRAAQFILRWLREHPEGGNKATLSEAAAEASRNPKAERISTVTVQRALIWLRDQQDAPIVFERPAMVWRLTDASFSLPMFDPMPRDLQAVLFASSLLEPVADPDLAARLRRLVEEMDQRVRDSGSPLKLRRGTVTATITQGQPVDPAVLETLLGAAGRAVIRFEYASPWSEGPPGPPRIYDVEPWQLRIHDNRIYLRGYARNRSAPRSFRVALMSSVVRVPELSLSQPMPPEEHIWDDGDPAFGIDHDRPDVAVVVLRGPVARWAALERWHDEQVDRWLEPRERLERTVPYASCREFARRLMTVADGLEHLQPPALRAQVASLAASAAGLCADDPDGG